MDSLDTNIKRLLQLFLKGQWLREAGFEIGNRVTLECENGTIVIKADENLKN